MNKPMYIETKQEWNGVRETTSLVSISTLLDEEYVMYQAIIKHLRELMIQSIDVTGKDDYSVVGIYNGRVVRHLKTDTHIVIQQVNGAYHWLHATDPACATVEEFKKYLNLVTYKGWVEVCNELFTKTITSMTKDVHYITDNGHQVKPLVSGGIVIITADNTSIALAACNDKLDGIATFLDYLDELV